jgi:serine/threonine protein kinase
MIIAAGTHLGSYEVLAPIGSGGMGEVYQAHDIKLGRDVAIKVLPKTFAHDPGRLSRIQHEARSEDLRRRPPASPQRETQWFVC